MATIKSVVSIEAKSKGFKSAVTDVDSLTRGTTRLGNASSAAGRAFAAQSKGLGGLVAAYAGAAATIFALQQAFSALNQAAKNEQLIQGTKTLASAVGQSGDKILNTLQKITKAQISVAASAEQANAALAAGFSGEQIEQLASIASKASKALGRDLTDAFSRLIRGAGKLEPELLDELGIFTRLEHSVGLYANQLGKAATTLTQFERRQAFVNSVIEEGNRKFTSISISEATAAQNLSKLVATLANLGQAVGGFIANALNPLVEFFNNNLFNSIALFGVLAATVFGKAVSLMKEGAISLSKSLEETNIKVANFFTSTKQQNALLEVQNAAAKINSNQVRGASNAGLRNAINATKDEVTFAEALIAKQEAQLKIKRNDAEILRAENTIAGSRASEAGKQKARETVTRLSNMNLVLTDIVSATDKAVESQNRLAKSIQGTISRISAVFSAVLFYGSKLLGWIGFAITAFSVLQLVLDKFGVSDTFDGILTSISRGVASMLGFTESVKKANESVNSLGQSLFNALASDGKLDINKATAVKGQSWLAKRLGIDPESVKFTEELISKEIQTLTKKFKDITTERSKEIANQENIFNQTMRSATGRTGVAPTAEYQQPFLEQKDKNIMEIDLNSIKATAAAIGELTKTYQELNGEGAKTVHFIIKAAEESHRLSQEGPDALADLKTAADETGISFEKLFKFFSIGDNKLSSTSQFLPNFEPSITSYAEFNELRKLGARNEIAARQEINERELAFVRLLNVAVDLQADVVTGLASEEALSAKLGALRNVELEITKQIANIKLQPTTDEELIKLYSDQVELLQKRLDIIASTTKQIRVQAEYQIAISQQTEKLKKSFSEEFNAASQITGVLSKQAMFAQSALEIRANELEQLSVVLDNTAEVRKLESEGVKLKNSQIALSREGIVAEQILFGLAVKVSQEQKKIIDDLKKQNTDASNKLRAAQLQQELVVIQNKQKYSELAFDVVEKELGLKQEQLNVSQKIEEITIRTSNLLRKTTLALLGELASGPLSNLFSSENNRNIEISIAENDLEEFRRINESQIKLAQDKAANDKALLLNELEKENSRNKFQLEIIRKQEQIAIDQVKADQASYAIEQLLLDEKFALLKEEALILERHTDRLGKIFADDLIQRQALAQLAKEQGEDTAPQEEAKKINTRFKDIVASLQEMAEKSDGPKKANEAAKKFAADQERIENLSSNTRATMKKYYETLQETAKKTASDSIKFENQVTSDLEKNIRERSALIDAQLNAQIVAANEEVNIRQKTIDKLKKLAEFEGDLFVQIVNLLFGELKKAIKESSDQLGKALVRGDGVGKALFSFGDNLRTAFVDSAGGALSLSIQKYVEKSIINPIQDEFLAAFGLDTNAVKSPQEQLVALNKKIEENTRKTAEGLGARVGDTARAALNPTTKALTSVAFATSLFFENKVKNETEAVVQAQNRESIAKEQLTKVTEQHKTAVQAEKAALDATKNAVIARTNAEKTLQTTIGKGIDGYSGAADAFISTAKELQRSDDLYSQSATRTVQLGLLKEAQEDIVKSATEQRIEAEKKLANTQKISSIAISALTLAIGKFANSAQVAASSIINASNAVAGAGATAGANGGIVGAITSGFQDTGSFITNIGTKVLSEIGKKLFNFDGLITNLTDSIAGIFGAGSAAAAGASAYTLSSSVAAESLLLSGGGAAAGVGASIASVLPYIGLVIGALSLFGAFRKKESVGPNANASGKLVNGEYRLTDSGADNGGDRSAALKLNEATGKTLKNIQDIFSISYTGGESPQFRTGYFKGKYFGGVTDPAGGGNHFERQGFDDAADAVAFAIAATLRQAADKGTLRASKDITDAIKNLDLSEAKAFTAEKFQEVLEFSANFSQLLDKLNNVALTAANYAEFAAKSASARVRGVFSEISEILNKTSEIFGAASSQFVAAQQASQNYILQTLGLQRGGAAGGFEAFKRNKDTVGAYQFRLAEVRSTFTAGSDANLAYREGLKKTGLTDDQINNIFTEENKQKVVQQLGKEFYEAVSNGLNPGREAAIAFAEDTARYLTDAQALYQAGAITQAQYEESKSLAQKRYAEVVAAVQREIEDLTRKLQDAAIATNQAKVDLANFASNLKAKVIPELQEGLKQTRDAIRGLASDLVGQFQSATDKLYTIFDSTNRALVEATENRKAVEKKYGVDSTRSLDTEIAAKQARLNTLSAEVAAIDSSAITTLGGFVEYSRKTAELRQLSVDIPKLSAAKKEIDAARNKEAQLTGDLAFVTKELNDTGLDLVTQRYSESEIVKETRKAVTEFTKAQQELGKVIYEIATNDATSNLLNINRALLDTDNKVYKVNAGFGTFITRAAGVYDETLKGATANQALANIFQVATERGNQLNVVLEGVSVTTLQAYSVLTNNLNPAFTATATDAETLRKALDAPNEGLSDSFRKVQDLISGPSGLIQQTLDLGNAQAALILVQGQYKQTIDDLTVGARAVNPFVTELRDKLNGVRDALRNENGVSEELENAKDKFLEIAAAITSLPGDLGSALREVIQAATDPTYFINQFRSLADEFATTDQSKYRNVSSADSYYANSTDSDVQKIGSIVRRRDQLIGRISDPNQIQSILSNTYGDTATSRSSDLGAVNLRSRYAQLTGSTLPNIGEFAALASGEVEQKTAAIRRGEAPISDYNDLITKRNNILNRYTENELKLIDQTYYGSSLYGTTGTSAQRRSAFFSNLAENDKSSIAYVTAGYNAATTGDISAFAALASQASAPGMSASTYQSLVTQRNALLNTYNPTQLRGVYNAYYANTLPGIDPTNKSSFISALGVQDSNYLQTLNSKPPGYNSNYGFNEFQGVANQFNVLGVAGANIYAANQNATGQEAMWYSSNDYTTRRVGEIIRDRNNILNNITSMGQLNNIIGTYGYATSSDPGAVLARNRLAYLQTNYPAAYASGGSVMRRDRVNAMLEPGEFVLRKQAVDQIGRDNLTEINSTGRVNSGNVEVNIINNGTAQEVEGVPVTRRDGDKMIVDVILRDLRNNGPIARRIKTGTR